MSLKAPFPYFGGKSAIAALVWERFGDVPNYVEPFFGSGAMLLGRPDKHSWWQRVETVNDLDGFVANFWRAVQYDPGAVAQWADWPVSEPDLHARHLWLLGQRERIVERLCGSPDWFDAQAAGWWVWGICSWIGSGWCSGNGPWFAVDGELVSGNAGKGINRQLPHLGNAGRGHCAAWSEHLQETMAQLAERLRRVRVCCGDWSRICGLTPTLKMGLTGVFLDPPYGGTRTADLYTQDDLNLCFAVRDWAVAHGDEADLRIALCGYEGEYEMPDSWECVPWKAKGGYASEGDGTNLNAHRERVWFSPHCLSPDVRQPSLWDAL